MTGEEAEAMMAAPEKHVEPCNFRSAGRLSNENARVLTSLFETLARNVMNTLDVYLGAALEVKLASLQQLSMDEYRAQAQHTGYLVPCTLAPATSALLLQIDSGLLYTMVDLLLGGMGAQLEGPREMTEIDEEIMLGVIALLAQQVERLWQPVGVSVKPGAPLKSTMAHKLFPPMEKVMLVRFEMGVAGISGAIGLVFPASLGGHLVRNMKMDAAAAPGSVRYFPRLSLEQRILECRFALEGCLPEVGVPVRSLSTLAVGDIFLLPASVDAPGRLTLEGHTLFEASPVRSGQFKAVQLHAPLSMPQHRKGDML